MPDKQDARGDLYEYMLSKLAQAGTNGQFRTPRHIIRMMVELMDLQPGDTICDPACGTIKSKKRIMIAPCLPVMIWIELCCVLVP